MSTKTGDVDVKDPEAPRGLVHSSILGRRRRIDRALHTVVMGAYVHWASTWKVGDLV